MRSICAADRLGWLSLGLVSLGVLGLARQLVPASNGFGTHTQLGLPACAFHQRLGLPCPACGLTTAFAHLAHGSFAASLAAHPLGVPLCGLLVVLSGRALLGFARADALRSFVLGPYVARGALLATLALWLVWCVRLVAAVVFA